MTNLPVLALAQMLALFRAASAQCPTLTLPPYGRFLRGPCNSVFGAECYIGCQPGFDLIGSCYRVCDNSGKWSGSPTACVRMSLLCPRLQLAPDVVLTSGCQNSAGFECTFACSSGALIGVDRIYCQQDGQWSGPAPTCTGGTTANPTTGPNCPVVYAPLNGQLAGGACNTAIGSVCAVTCNQGKVT